MASTRFTVLTGHLSQHSLADLIGILRHQRKTGRLLIEYIGSPAILFFKDGDLVDAQYNTLIGVQAIFVAFVQPAAAFNFNPLIQPTRFSIDSEQQRVILELLGCWTEDMIVVSPPLKTSGVYAGEAQQPEIQGVDPHLLIAPPPVERPTTLKPADEVLALPPAPSERSKRRSSARRPWVLAAATFVLLLIFGVPTLIAISNKVRKPTTAVGTLAPENVVSGPVSATSKVENAPVEPTNETAAVSSTSFEPKRQRESVTEEARPEKPLKEIAASSPTTPDQSASMAPGDQAAQPEKSKQPASSGQTVKVIMRIENGRVIQATVGDRRPGAEGLESLALRIARQRRYPPGVNKQETLIMKVDGPK